MTCSRAGNTWRQTKAWINRWAKVWVTMESSYLWNTKQNSGQYLINNVGIHNHMITSVKYASSVRGSWQKLFSCMVDNDLHLMVINSVLEASAW